MDTGISTSSSSAAAAASSGALAASPAPAAAPRSGCASLTLSAACGGRVKSSRAPQRQQKQSMPSSSAAAESTGSPTFEYQDHFLGKVSVIPVAQRHQLDAPLLFVKAWLRFSRGRRAALGTALPQPPPPVDHWHTQFALWPAQRARGMPELTVTTCHRLSTAPASLNVYFRVASGWRALILDRVVSGYMNKIQQTRDGAYECVIFNGHVYKSLGTHDPHSTQVINEYAKLYDLHSAWRICFPTPDALHVCVTYPWAAYALVFADGSAHWTANGPKFHASYCPGKMQHAVAIQTQTCDCR